MSIEPGNALHFQLPFGDGGQPDKPRPYLVVNATSEYLYLLNVSSVKRKERKLEMPSNKQIINELRYPPFPLASFVKMDFVYQIPNKELLKQYLMDNGTRLHEIALNDVMQALNLYEHKKLHIISEQQLYYFNGVH